MRGKILVIEDEMAINDLISMNLEVTGYEVVSCLDGLEAEETLKKEADFDLALVDIMLPGKDGFALLPELKAAGIPVIFLTAKADVQSKVRGLKEGAEDYIVKPFRIRELLARVRRILSANIKNGGRTPVAGMVHSITLVIVLVVLMPFAGMIPMPTIAAILFVVAYNMCQWRTFVHMLKTAPKSDIIVLIVTFILTVVFDLVVAIEIGMVIACLLFIKRMSEETRVDSWVYVDDDTPEIDDHLARLPLAIRVYEITGPLFFGASDAIEHIVVKDFTKCLILRMRSVPALDSTALNALKDLVDTCEKKGITIVFSHVNEQPMKVMKKAGFIELVGKEHFCPNIAAALKHAEDCID